MTTEVKNNLKQGLENINYEKKSQLTNTSLLFRIFS